MATPKSFRSWSSVDSVDPNDVRRLYETDTSPGAQKPAPGRCVSTWTFSLVVLTISVFLLVGLFVGYYIRDGTNYPHSRTVPCDYTYRTDGFSPDRLRMVHENVMYLMSGRRVMDTAGQMSTNTEKSDGTLDKKLTNYIYQQLVNSGLDKVETVDHDVEVVTPDEDNPSTITLTENGQEILTLKYGSTTGVHNSTEHTEGDPTVAVPGSVMGNLVYGFYGRRQDLYLVKNANITLKDSVLLLKMGEITIMEKLRLASLEKVSGVILYQDPADSHVLQEELYFTSFQLNNKRFCMPVQVVTYSDADRLLESLHSGVAAPDEWKFPTGRGHIGIIPNRTISSIVVDLRVRVTQRKETITNVIGSIYGDMEPDRFVVVGSSRTETIASNLQDLHLGTVHLLEMAQAFASIKFADKWGPRRGVRFCSWGGGTLQKGLVEFLKVNQYVVGRQTIAYIDLDLYLKRSSSDDMVFEVSSSPALDRLIQHVLHQVPHPEDKQLTIADWQYESSGNQFELNGSPVVRNVLNRLGVPVVSVGYRSNQNVNDAETTALLHDFVHHDQYHLAASRVNSLVALHLMDDDHLPLSMVNYTKSIHDVFARSLLDLTNAQAKVDTEKLPSSIDDLTRIGKAFENYLASEIFTQIPLGSRRMNDIKMGMDKIMVSPEEFKYSSSLLYDMAPDGSSALIKEAISTAKVTKDWSEVQHILKIVNRALLEAISYLQLS